ncbi:Ser/Thr protein kinase RdoA (MazF antagonist) [Rhizobium sp. BK529]|uniref:aminoglycoside phosphotransferase family protein n=1 Tax=unclassified Rhizobium TaxID=2613769 RepID=UPI0010508490|nr:MULTISPECIES: aminoglycoside phosphotransferase family protein [unclassified Rhizobium]MBB3594145.1 Ser/Thr protein kinase RdoA (MazF antagonist) [Rhizobium sp. BK529]TCS01600.1 Ser/Thr protein kinase RdoA (MazF antagonist) [Rhizobium sp. BK418]
MAPERRTTLELDTKAVQQIVQNLDADLVAGGFARLHGGSTEIYRIDLANADYEPLVLKIYPDDPEWGPANEKLVAGWIRKLTPLAPKWLEIDESRSLLPLRYALLPLLPGRSLRDWMAETDIEQAYRQMGALLRNIHAMSMPAYGYLLGYGINRPMPTNADYMTSAFEDVFRRFRDLGGDADLGRRLQLLSEANFGLLQQSSGAVLCHDDFHQGNVLALRNDSGRLQLSGLIDFGNARAADRFFDLAKALFCSAHEDPRSYKPILEGYGSVDHPDIGRTLWLYTLFHRLSMWCWLMKLGLDPATENGPGGLLRDLHTMVRVSDPGITSQTGS